MAEALALQGNPYAGNPELQDGINASPEFGLINEQTFNSPIEAVTESYTPNMLGRLAEGARARYNKLNKFVKGGAAVVLGSLAVGSMEASINTESAYAGTPTALTAELPATAPVTIKETSTEVQLSVAGDKQTDHSLSRVTVLGNHRVVSKAKIEKAKKQEKCQVIDGKKKEVWTEGLSGNGTTYGRDYRKSLFCKVNVNGVMQLVRAKCGNKARSKMPKQHTLGKILWVDSLNKALIRVSAKSYAKAEAECKTTNTSAKASGYGEGSSSASLSYRAYLKAKGKLSSLIQSKSLKAKAEAESSASAEAQVQCQESKTTTKEVVPPTEKGAKDGTKTPEGPVSNPAPGENPDPSPEEPYPGGYQCYRETDGAPVAPVDGLCPTGSYGS